MPKKSSKRPKRSIDEGKEQQRIWNNGRASTHHLQVDLSKMNECQEEKASEQRMGMESMQLQQQQSSNQRQLVLNEFKLCLEVGIQDMKEDVDKKFDDLMEKLLTINYNHYCNNEDRKKQVATSTAARPMRKSFFPRESILSLMLDSSHSDENYRTIFNIALSALFLWGASLAVDDFVNSGNLAPNWELLTWGLFKDIHFFFYHWTIMFASSFLVIPLAHVIAETESSWTYRIFLILYSLFQITAFIFSAFAVNYNFTAARQLAMPLAMGLMAEQARMSMKMHSYLREKLTWQLFNEKHTCRPITAFHLQYNLPVGNHKVFIIDLPAIDLTYGIQEFKNYFYFFFAPTLIYRDKYPRTMNINWYAIVFRVLEFLGIVYYAYLIFREVLPKFGDNYSRKLSLLEFVKLSFSCMGPAMTCMVFTHFMVLHVVQNIGAEVTQFADRGFYGDWWNARTFSVYYRKWNGVVHDFIHSYLYTDLVQFCKCSKLFSLLASFIISALVHEYLICMAMGFFLPILGILFTGPGLIFILLTKNKTGRVWNIFMWMMLTIGTAFLMVVYIREYFARYHNIAGLDSLLPKYNFKQDPLVIWLSTYSHIEVETLLTIYDFFVPRTFRLQYYM